MSLIFFLLIRTDVFSQGSVNKSSQIWVDSVFNSLTPDERIAQLLMVRAYSNRDSTYVEDLTTLVKELNLGGVCFFQGGPARQALVTNRLQQNAKTPLFIAIDGEWGAGMRLDSLNWFPKQMTLGAISNDSLIYEMGAEIARQMKRLGVQINFAPVADINNNPLNPVINARSFGEDRYRVAQKAAWYMKGMQDYGLIAVAKHFPGHGDTGMDSHYTLPVINKSRAQLDSTELFPFRYLIDKGVKGIMVSHLTIPALDTASKSVATLSQPVILDLLRKEMEFDGMVITDGMDMKGLTDFSDPLMVEATALKAGNDILLLPVDARKAIENIRAAIDSGFISEDLINSKCLRVLNWKFESGLPDFQPIQIAGLAGEINSTASSVITRKADAGAVTLLTDPRGMIPLRSLDTLRIASLMIGDTALVPFQQMLSSYAPVTHFNLPKEPDQCQYDSIAQLLEPYNLIISGFVKTSDLPQKNFGVSRSAAAFIDSISLFKPLVMNIFTSPYVLETFRNTDKMLAVLVSYQDNATMQQLTAQALFGGIAITGKLPVTSGNGMACGSGLIRNQVSRFSFGLPEEAGLSSVKLLEVDSILMAGLASGVFPGAQVLVAKDGMVVYRKAFGYQTYSEDSPVRNDDLYDLASLTKMLATTLVAMKLTGDGIINPDQKLSHYLKPLQKSNKSQLTIRSIMAHQAGLQPYIPFYKKLLIGDEQDSTLIGRHYSIAYPVRVADGFYLRDKWPQFVIDSIVGSPLLKKTEYKYSDLGFILLGETFSQLTDQSMSSFVQKSFYRKLGLTTMGYHPRDCFSISRIAPTENDTIFRKQVIHGDVHDPAAAMMGGVAGHAGLFSDALDVAIIMQMLLQHGKYGGEMMLDSAVIDEFTKVQFPENRNRRGMGFDKPSPAGEPGPACDLASPLSFGHSGFTGTYAWADPETGLVYVFLSNRVYPDAGNNKITQTNIRTNIQEAIYKSIK
ncbi:MAG: serine hydrolase [Bacteroidales bacterium]|nr:serine hydrolase [Bacteroidales bacterium]